MATRVEIATQPWGVVQDRAGNVQAGVAFTFTTAGGGAVTRYTTADGSTPSTSTITDSNGAIPGFVAPGSYTVAVGGTTHRVEAVAATNPHIFNILDAPYNAVLTGLGDNTAAIQAAINDLVTLIGTGGNGEVLIPGVFDVTGTLTVPVNTPVTLRGYGKGRPLVGGSRLHRSSGTAPIISAVGTGNSDATRVTLNLHDVVLDGGNTNGTVLKIQRANDCTLRNVQVGWSTGTGCQFSQLWNCEIDTLHVHDCGNGTTSPAVLFDAISSVSQGASDTVNCSNWQLEANTGTPLRLTGSVADTAPTSVVQMVNLKIEGSGGAWPQIDLDYAQACKFTNVQISNVDTATVAIIRQTGTTAGARTNQFENLVVDTTAPVAYFVDHTVGALSIANVNFIGAGAGFVAFVRVGVNVGVGDFGVVGATTNSPGKLVDDQRVPKGRYERLRGQAVWDPPSVASGAATSTTVTVTGARLADVVSAALDHVVPAGCILAGNVTANDTVTVTLANFSGGAVDIASSALVVDVLR